MTPNEARASILSGLGITRQSSAPVDAVRACVGVQTQYAASLPGAVSARCTKLRPGWDVRALERGALVKSWTLRGTVHTHSPEDYALMVAALGKIRRKRYLSWMNMDGRLGSPNVEELEARIVAALAHGPLDRRQLHEHVPEFKGMPMVGWGIDVMGLAYLGRVVLLSPAKGATRFKLTGPPANLPDESEALAALLHRYLESHAPATLSDFAYWAGIPASSARIARHGLGEKVATIEIDGFKEDRLVLTGSSPSERRKHVRFLAKFDPLLMGHRDKTLFVPTKLHKEIFRPAGQVEAVVLENGKLTATWRLDRKGKDGMIVVKPLATNCLVKGRGLDREIERLRSSLALREIDLRRD